jgi:hypothetical protein
MTSRSLSTRSFTLGLGVVLLVLGAAGFLPPLLAPLTGITALRLHGGAGALLGAFPVNWLLDLVHVALGIWAIAAAGRFVTARSFLKAAAVILGLLALLGVIPGLHVLLGLMPLYGNDVWLHGLLAVAAAIYGWRPVSVTDEAGLTAAPVAE